MPITRAHARELAVANACTRPDWLSEEDEIIIIDEATIEKPWGWIFFYDSRKWRETKDITYAIAGNAPLLIERESGQIHTTGTGKRIEYYIENFERTGNPHTA